MAPKWEIKDTEMPGGRGMRFNSWPHALRELKACVGAPGRFVLIDRQTKEVLLRSGDDPDYIESYRDTMEAEEANRDRGMFIEEARMVAGGYSEMDALDAEGTLSSRYLPAWQISASSPSWTGGKAS